MSAVVNDRVRKRSKRRSRDLTSVLLTVWALAVLIFLFAPIIVIVAYSFNDGRLLTSWSGFGFDAYSSAFSKPVIRDAVLTSVKAAAGAAVVSTVIGSFAGIAMARRGGRATLVLTVLLAMTLITPEIVNAISLLGWFVSLANDVGISLFNEGLPRLVISQAVLSTAVVAFIVRARVAGTDSSLEEAAADLYASPLARFRDITLPLALPGILAGFFMAFTISLDNTIVSSFVAVPGTNTWPVYIFSALRNALRPEVAAMSTVMLALTLLALSMVVVVLRRSGDTSSDISKTFTGG